MPALLTTDGEAVCHRSSRPPLLLRCCRCAGMLMTVPTGASEHIAATGQVRALPTALAARLLATGSAAMAASRNRQAGIREGGQCCPGTAAGRDARPLFLSDRSGAPTVGAGDALEAHGREEPS